MVYPRTSASAQITTMMQRFGDCATQQPQAQQWNTIAVVEPSRIAHMPDWHRQLSYGSSNISEYAAVKPSRSRCQRLWRGYPERSVSPSAQIVALMPKIAAAKVRLVSIQHITMSSTLLSRAAGRRCHELSEIMNTSESGHTHAVLSCRAAIAMKGNTCIT